MEKSVIKSRIMKYWLPFAVVIAAIIRMVMVNGLPINPIPKAACDDLLLKNWGYSILNGEWTGKFDSFTFVKEVGFSIFLAACPRLHISYLFGISLIYTTGTIVFSWALYKIVSNKYVWFFLYLAILFNPLSYAAATTQRVYRNGLGLALTLWVFGTVLNLYFSIVNERIWQPAIWSLLAGGSLGFLWIVKSDTIWLMPFVAVVLIVSAGLLLIKRRKASSIFRVALLLIPLAGIWVCSSYVSHMNVKVYGSNGIPYYGLAFHDMTSTIQENEVKSCSMTRATFEQLCEVSPTLDSVKDSVLSSIDLYDAYDTHPKDGNLEDGWLGWAFISAIEHSGYYKDCQTANTFYEKVYKELETAYQSGKIVRKVENKLTAYHLDTSKDRKEMMSTLGEIFHYVASFQDVSSQQSVISLKDITGVLPFETLTRNHASYELGDHDYYLNGWIFYPGYDLAKLQVHVEDGNGNQYAKLDFAKSADVAKANPNQKSAAQCRFTVLWDAKSGKSDKDYYLCAYDGDHQISKVSIMATGFSSHDATKFQGTVDTYINYNKTNQLYYSSKHVVNRMNVIADCYKATGLVINSAGMIAYVIFTITFFYDLKKKRFENVNAWLVVTGMLLSLFILFFGIAVTDLEQCPAIGYMYLSSAYALLMAVAVISIYLCVKRVTGKKNQKSE